MARKPLGPMDVNEYYRTMGARPEADMWEMPIYNTVNKKPITGEGRQAARSSGNFAAPKYNDQGKPIISSGEASPGQGGNPMFQVEVYRPGVVPGQQFKAPKYNDMTGQPITNDNAEDTASGNVYRPSQLKKSGTAIPMSRTESLMGWGETRKVLLNNSFSAYGPMPIGSFTKISGMETEWELESYHEGGDNGGDHMFPSQIRNSRLVFEYGTGFLDPLTRWFDMIRLGMMIKLPLMIFLNNEQKLPVKMWMLLDAMPVKYSAPNFDAMASEVAITRIEFIHNGLINIL